MNTPAGDIEANPRCILQMHRQTVVWLGTATAASHGITSSVTASLRRGSSRRINGADYETIRAFLEKQPERVAVATILDGRIQLAEEEW